MTQHSTWEAEAKALRSAIRSALDDLDNMRLLEPEDTWSAIHTALADLDRLRLSQAIDTLRKAAGE